MKQPATYYHLKTCPTRIAVMQGGTRSGKTYSTLQVLAEWCWANQNAGWWITVVRKTFPSLRGSVLRDFVEILEGQGWYNPAMHNRSENTYHLFGNHWEFISVDQPAKVRGRKRHILFVNEATELALEDWRQLVLRTTHRIILDYNPSDSFHWIYDEVIPRQDATFYRTTYRDNPFLEPDVVAEIERLQHADPNYWRIYGMGERGLNMAAVFPAWKQAPRPEAARLVAVGLDWGFANDPTAVVAVYRHGNELYLDELLYTTGLTNPEIAQRLLELLPHRAPIVADSAEPKSIEELHRHGLYIRPAKKGPDSVRAGIDIMRRHVLHATPTSANLQAELRAYRWQEDKNGRYLNHPHDANNHAVDAVRYVCLNHLHTNRAGTYAMR